LGGGEKVPRGTKGRKEPKRGTFAKLGLGKTLMGRKGTETKKASKNHAPVLATVSKRLTKMVRSSTSLWSFRGRRGRQVLRGEKGGGAGMKKNTGRIKHV